MDLKYGEFETATDMLPEVSVNYLIARGWAHFMGNQVAAKVTAWKESYADDHGGDLPNDAEIAVAQHDFRKEFLARLEAGTVGERASAGPRADEFERMCRAVAEEFLRKALKGKGVKFPVKDETIMVAGEALTRDQLISRRADKDDVRDEARRRLDVAADAGADILG